MINPLTGNTYRFDWLAHARNTVNEIVSTWKVGTTIAKEIQHNIARGATEQEVNAIAAASKALCSQVGF